MWERILCVMNSNESWKGRYAMTITHGFDSGEKKNTLFNSHTTYGENDNKTFAL